MSGTTRQLTVEIVSPRGRSAADLDDDRLAVPLPPRGVVHRERLLRRLDSGAGNRLTLVTAPAGTGKTLLVSTWVARRRAPGVVVWVSLDDAWLDRSSLWYLVGAGLARQGVETAAAPRSMAESPAVSTPGDVDANPVSQIARRIAAHSTPVVLVLDCEGALPVHAAGDLDALLHRLGNQLRVVLLTREDPLMPLHRYRLAETLVELRMEDLAFTTTEARDLLIGTGVDLSEGAMDAVILRTQGWAAGLRMAAMSLAQRADREVAARRLAGDSGTVAEYLLAEVLNTQPPAIRRLLLETSIVDVLFPGLASALAGPQADRALSFLVHGNAFLEELRDRRGGYRYHQLFRGLLRAQLAFEAPQRWAELHRLAAAWMATHGRIADAVRHCAETRDWEAAARYVIDDLAVARLLMARPADALTEAVALIPTTADGPAAAVVQAAVAVARDDLAEARSFLALARHRLSSMGAETWPAGELSMHLLDLVVARRGGATAPALVAADASLRLLGNQPAVLRTANPELSTTILSNLGAALILAGRLEQAAEAFARVAEKCDADPARLNAARIEALGQSALLAALRGDLRRSADLAGRALRDGSEAGSAPAFVAAEVALAYVYAELWDLGAARRLVARTGAFMPTYGEPLPAAMLALVRARVAWADGEFVEGLSAVDDVLNDELPGWMREWLVLEKVAMLVADGRPETAVATARELSEPGSRRAGLSIAADLVDGESAEFASIADHGLPAPGMVDGLLWEAARNLKAGGGQRRALRALEQALRLAAPEQRRRPFRQAPVELWTLLRQNDQVLRRHPWLTGAPGDPADGLVRQPGRPAGTVMSAGLPIQLIEPLTDKEREVLEHLSELLTTEEIAGEMYISVNTVRTHVRNILRKLAASRRNEAVRRARELKIISA